MEVCVTTTFRASQAKGSKNEERNRRNTLIGNGRYELGLAGVGISKTIQYFE